MYVESSGSNTSEVYSNVVEIDENSTMIVQTIVSANPGTNGPDASTSLQIETVSNNWLPIHTKPNGSFDTKIIGPAKVRLAAKSGNYGTSYSLGKIFMTYQIILNNANGLVSTSSEKKFATVIPENASTNIRVVLEQSTDLINWTAASPGVFPPSTAKRFFRVRSEEE